MFATSLRFICDFLFQFYYNFVSTLSRINKFDNMEIVRLVGICKWGGGKHIRKYPIDK